ncbi:hypothetical protein E1265_32245 [Streptomyces sp. 8K308]|nr:hypothetical protein E1265_32245 [Streptomyces sp. 8K308]
MSKSPRNGGGSGKAGGGSSGTTGTGGTSGGGGGSSGKDSRSAVDPMTTRPAREAGYRDGTRAGRAVAKAKAYRHGARDGWTDATTKAQREKEQMDKAKAKTEKKAEPIGVSPGKNGGLVLDGADRDALSSGEVRRVDRYLDVMARKAKLLERMTEEAQVLVDTCKEMRKRVTILQDAAKVQEAGEKTQEALALYAEKVREALQQAEQQQERLLKAADRAREVQANARERYRLITAAVQDAGRTAPANMTYYQR